MKKDTIAAIATGLTDAGIGIIRISGKNAVEVGDRLFRLPSGRKMLSKAESHRMYYGYVAEENKDFIIDEVMIVVMRAPRSFTGEDTVEIQCHGGVLVMKKILSASLSCGARLAEPGEFTKRAFLNGRIDLAGAEAVMDVIQSQNEYALASSVSQLKGALSGEIRKLRAEMIHEIAFIESALDDPEHFSLENYPEELYVKIEMTADKIKKMIDTADNGKLIKEGIRTVIVGKPNAGKSSLLNCIAGEERAIVTDIAGTTRDILQETVKLGEICLNIVDTAGIRDTGDIVEKIGVEKAKESAESADLIVYVVDTSTELDENDREIISLIMNKPVIVLMNKSDLKNIVTEEMICSLFQEILERESYKEDEENKKQKKYIKNFFQEKRLITIKTSAREEEGLDIFEKAVKDMFFKEEIKSTGEIVITNMRHKEALQEAFDSLMLVKKSIEDGMPEDFYSIDLINAYASLGRIIGEEVDDDLVEEIFSKFCMGK
nr:tRNA uridine-5-carboxymethylaminomethyl(34) synthesis GTPase MnmE [uncultured Acetatifactor sp.]